MTKDEALKLAREALETCEWVDDGGNGHAEYTPGKVVAALLAIKEALAQPEQEPVARYFEDYQGQPIEEIDEARFNQTPDECRFKLYTAPPQPEQEPVAQWHLSKDGLPPVGSEVVGGYFYKDTWLKGEPEVFAWGQCRVIKDDHPDFPDGKRWITFGPSHNQITYWCWPPKKPGDTTPPQRKPLTADEISEISIDVYGYRIEKQDQFARAIEAAHDIKE